MYGFKLNVIFLFLSCSSYVTKSVMKKKEFELRERVTSKKFDILFKKDAINLKYDKLESENARNVGCLSVYSSRCCML